jgi:hypothetical protein
MTSNRITRCHQLGADGLSRTGSNVQNTHHHGFFSTATHSILVFGRATCREECQIACEGHPLVLDPPIRIYRRDVGQLSGCRDE